MRKRYAVPAGMLVVGLICSAVWVSRSSSKIAALSTTPAYYEQPPAQLPAVLDAKRFTDPEIRKSYEAAKANAHLFSQLPCYCYCDRSSGHKSLLSCFADGHGTQCSICRREALFAAAEAKRGRSASEVRQKIIRGLWAEGHDSMGQDTNKSRNPESISGASQ